MQIALIQEYEQLRYWVQGRSLSKRLWSLMCCVDGRNELSRPDEEKIVSKLKNEQKIDASYLPFGDGHAAEKIVNALEKY